MFVLVNFEWVQTTFIQLFTFRIFLATVEKNLVFLIAADGPMTFELLLTY